MKLSVPPAIIQILSENPNRIFSTYEIADCLRSNFPDRWDIIKEKIADKPAYTAYAAVGNLLSGMQRRGQIISHKYQAAPKFSKTKSLQTWSLIGADGSQKSQPSDNCFVKEAYEEGSPFVCEITRYERNRRARDACLKYYGYKCVVCDVLLEEVYGARGKNVIQVHHIKPMSQIRRGYKVNPIKDLRPVCPNCHTIIHNGDEVLSIDEARSLFHGK
ncbi:HNH endonuclease [Rhizobium paknamense]|uniref:HNH domain-containing protein n=1 Tax=Rhizobium paknamense TaxID=1206817 RepID=A0ABU0I688_9HYPH|nr:HNH endonuclease [Rhizobium paknamense]MDQ0453735.1 hypothetical protein [Rhizobium paknamense]